MASSRPAICVLGGYERDYPRNACVRRMLADLGWEVVECHSDVPFPQRHVALAREYLRVRDRVAAIWVAEGGHRLVPWVKALARLDGVPVVFDPFLSRWSTRVEDRRLFAPGSLQAWIAAWQDWSSCSCADHLVFDTHEHQRWFFDRYGLRRPWDVLEVGIDEDVFTQAGPAEPRAREGLDVLFYGTYIPLHGVDTIVAAAAELRGHADVHVTLVGAGQELPHAQRSIARLGLRNVALVGPMPPVQLAARIRTADVVLGIFGTSAKAAAVVPNKVVQCAAMGKAIVTRRSAAVQRWFTDDIDVAMVEAADAEALAHRLIELRDDAAARARLGAGARAVFERRYAAPRQRETLAAILARAGVTPPLTRTPARASAAVHPR